MKKAAILSLL